MKEEIMVKEIKKIYKVITSEKSSYKKKVVAVKALLDIQCKDGSWSVLTQEWAPKDAMIDFVFVPTYYATASLMHLMNRNPEFEYKTQLDAGLNFITDGGNRECFPGHGYDVEENWLEALRIYKKAGAYQWIDKYGAEYEVFSKMITGLVNSYKHSLSSGNADDRFGEDYTAIFRKEVEDYEAHYK